jgi:hypothetical protein
VCGIHALQVRVQSSRSLSLASSDVSYRHTFLGCVSLMGMHFMGTQRWALGLDTFILTVKLSLFPA